MPANTRSDHADARPTAGDLQAPVLVAVDFSPDSEAALRWAVSHAAQPKRLLVVSAKEGVGIDDLLKKVAAWQAPSSRPLFSRPCWPK